jgi:hypothetical protein
MEQFDRKKEEITGELYLVLNRQLSTNPTPEQVLPGWTMSMARILACIVKDKGLLPDEIDALLDTVMASIKQQVSLLVQASDLLDGPLDT